MIAPLVWCRACGDYTLELRYADGLQGAVYLERLLDIGAFACWRDLRVFMTARVADEDGHTVVWPAGGVHLDADILYADIAIRRAFPPPAPSADDPGFVRFMHRALRPPKS